MAETLPKAQVTLGFHSPASSVTVADDTERADAIQSEKIEENATKIPELDASFHPYNFSKQKKWTITVIACFFTLLVSAATTSFTSGYPSMMRDLNLTYTQAVVGLSTYVLAFAITPLFTSAFSEEFGRQPLYVVSVVVFLLMHVMIALAPNIAVIAVARIIQGAVGSTGSTMVAGTIADIWEPKQRGLPMALYSILAFGGNGVGTIAAGWIEANPKLEWKWIQWISMMVAGCYSVVFAFTMRETRAPVLQAKMIKRKAREARAKGDLQLPTAAVPKSSFKELLWISCTRPLILLTTEPIVTAMSVWLAFAWGVFYCMIGSLHGFSSGQIGTVNVSMIVAVLIGYLTTLLQEKIYSKKFHKRSVEARLYMCCAAGIGFPVSVFMFAWFCRPGIHWMLLCFAITIYYWSIFTIYLAVFTYLADCYTTYASSALAGQSMLRNVLGGVFPFFTVKMYDKLGYTWSNTIFACLALLLAPIPFIIFFMGPRIRKHSARCIHD
ncbi:hypothetical protein MD484_g3304, partial [Candolleomyces efflorescens]